MLKTVIVNVFKYEFTKLILMNASLKLSKLKLYGIARASVINSGVVLNELIITIKNGKTNTRKSNVTKVVDKKRDNFDFFSITLLPPTFG